jgi:hypothetical protein
MGYDPDAPSLTCREAEALYERINRAEDLLGIALSHLDGEPEYANKQAVINYLRAYFDARKARRS